MKLEDLACATCAIRRRASGSVSGSATSSRRACSACCTSMDARQGSSRPCLTVGGFLAVVLAPSGRFPVGCQVRAYRVAPGRPVKILARGWPGG